MIRRAIVSAALCLSPAWADAAQAPLCDAHQRTVFACATPGRGELALCASGDLAPGRGSLQYRHRRGGAIDLQYPRAQAGSRDLFLYAHYFRAGADRWQLRFVVDGAGYVLEESAGPRGRIARAVEVYRDWDAGTPTARLACAASTAPPLLRTLQDVVPCDADNALNLGGCPAR